VERLLQFRDVPERIRLTGGAARSEVWAQMFADIFQVPVEIPAGTELGALGAAICAAVACGIHDSYQTACEKMVRFDRMHAPNRDLADVYDRKYARYKQLLDVMAPVWSELAWKPE
jgi:L-xylulokinase